jgi:hypothetical protein
MTFEAREQAQQTRQASRRRSLELIGRSLDALVADAGPLPSWAQSHVKRARKGRLLSLVALKCGDCCVWDRSEIRLCPVIACSLHPVRPFRPRDEETP